MRISRVYIDAELAEGRVIALDKARAHYLKNVLRLKPGAAFLLFNGREAVDFESRLQVDGKRMLAEVGKAIPLATESGLGGEIIQGLGRADHIDWMIQKVTELGVGKISIFNAERTQSPLKAAQIEKKMLHWKAVASSACEQCGRAILPDIVFYARLEQALDGRPDSLKLLLDFDGKPLTALLQEAQSAVSILLGPEGGLNRHEIDLARGSGFRPASLGSRVLRFETAAVAALSIVQAEIGDFR